MGRAKIVMEPINNDKNRKTTFKTRKQSLIKKARELSIICDVNVAMIISTDDQETPEIFPPDRDNLNRLISLYKRNQCTDPGKINFYDISEYFTDRKIKIEEELVKAKKKNLQAKYPSWFDVFNSFSESQLRGFALGLENKIVDVRSRIEFVKQNLDRCLYSAASVGYSNSVVDPLGLYGDLMAQSSNTGLVNMRPVMMQSSCANLVMDMMLKGDDNVACDGEGFGAQVPLMEDCFEPEFMQQLLVDDVGSEVKNASGNATEIISYFN